MDTFKLPAEKRSVLGKKVKKLRREGNIPANLYGADTKSLALQVKLSDFARVYKKAGKTHVVYLSVGGAEYPTLIYNVQKHPVENEVLHIDFKKMNLKEKTEAAVPVEVIGELPIVKSGEADLMILMDTVTVLALPTNIPEKIVIDISKLEGIGSVVHIKDLRKGKDYEYIDEEDRVVLQIAAARKEELPAPVTEAETEEEGVVEGGEKEQEGTPAEEEKTAESAEK